MFSLIEKHDPVRDCDCDDCAKAERDRLRAVLDKLALYFTSGNEVPVERATILAKDFWRITDMAPNNQIQRAR